jgi:hypothetical protein
MATTENPDSTRLPKATEERLEAIRAEAAATGKVESGAGRPPRMDRPPRDERSGGGVGSSEGKFPAGESYYNLGVVKPPTWTWEIAVYFFVGGISGISSVIGFIGHVLHADPTLVRVALWMGLIGAMICPGLLIADLGRPSRFLNMLRVFKRRSAMSMGSWILSAFGGAAFTAVAANEAVRYGIHLPLLPQIAWIGEFGGAITGLLLASYTGVLIGATAIPVWHQHRHLLPAHFLTSGLGGSAAILELLGFLLPVTQFLGFAASAVETLLGISLELKPSQVNKPLHHGRSGWTMRIAGALEGPIALLIRVFLHGSAHGRYATAICFLIGSCSSRFAWIWAGRASAHDPHALFEEENERIRARAAGARAL